MVDVQVAYRKVPQLFLAVNSHFVEREEDVIAVLAGLLSGEPVLLVGDPGTGKTKMVEVLAKHIDAKYFYYLLTRFTEPDEIIGHIDINALRRGEYRRIMDNRLPDAHIVFLDEVFKASSAIRNILLDIILNKRVFDGTRYIKLPMLALYTASNEISYDEEDQAFLDRLVIRRFLKPVADVEMLLEKGVALEQDGGNYNVIMSVEDVCALQGLCKELMARFLDFKTKIAVAFNELRNKGINVSDRTKVKTLKVASALAILFDEKPSLDCFAEALRLTAVREPQDLEVVEEIIIENNLSSLINNIRKLEAMRAELENKLKEAKATRSLESLRMLNKVVQKIVTEVKRMPRNIRLIRYINEINALIKEVKALREEILEEIGELEE